jgi:hypothetical protein
MRFKSEFLRRIIEEAGGPMHVIGLEIKGERRFFIYHCALDGRLQYHLTHNGRYINFPRLEYAQGLVEALQSYVRTHYYEWQAFSTVYADITKRQCEVAAHRLVLRTDDGQHIPTGLAYFKKTGDGPDDFYSPLHLESSEQLLGFGFHNELAIQRFLQRLASVSPSPEYWCKAGRVACIEQFPGGFPAIIESLEQS